MLLKKYFVLLCVVVFTGCSSTVRMSEEDKVVTHNIRINTNIETPESMIYTPPSSGVFMMFGAIGGAMAAATSTDPANEIVTLARKNNITIDSIVRDEFTRQLTNGNHTFKINADQYDAVLNIKIVTYGLAISRGLSSEMYPTMRIEAQLISRNNKVIWQNSDYITALASGTPAITNDEIKNNPSKLGTVWSAAANIVVSNILKTL